MKIFKYIIVLTLFLFSASYGQEKKLDLPNVQLIKPITFNLKIEAHNLAPIKIECDKLIFDNKIVCLATITPIQKEASWTKNANWSLNDMLRYLK